MPRPPVQGRTAHGKPVKRWDEKPLPLPWLGPDEPTKNVKGDWRKRSDHEEVMRRRDG
jgi:hypothetical protein